MFLIFLTFIVATLSLQSSIRICHLPVIKRLFREEVMRQDNNQMGALSVVNIERIMNRCHQHRSEYIADMVIALLVLPLRWAAKRR
jgi:hypothetical protein